MITNQDLQRLVDSDRATLIALLSYASAAGSRYGWAGKGANDPLVKEMVDAARRLCAEPARGCDGPLLCYDGQTWTWHEPTPAQRADP
jgi:hypothetical protein